MANTIEENIKIISQKKNLYVKSIGLGLVVFEGSEHLQNIIEEIRKFLDYVVIGLQRISYNGEVLNPNDERACLALKDGGLVDEVIYIDLDKDALPRVQETNKRNLLIQAIEDHGCSHALIIDSDEFYDCHEFQKALLEIEVHEYPITYCRYVNYYHDYNHYLVYPFKEGNYVPFITETKYRFEFEGHDFPKPSDPTRRYKRPTVIKEDGKEYYTVSYHEFEWNVIKMHHLSWLRGNIRKKLYNWSAKNVFPNWVELIDRAVIAYDNFDETSNEGYKAKLLFNTPGNQVDVARWPKQYINPKHDFRKSVELPYEKTILILVMGHDHPQYNAQEEAIRETWKAYAEENFKNIKVLFYKEDKNALKPYLEGDTVRVPNEGTLEKTYSKTIDTIKFLEREGILDQYDYVFRTNTSTFLNIDLLNDYVSRLDKYEFKMHCAEIDCCWWSKMHFYAKGNALLMNKQMIKRVLYLENKKMEETFRSCDDCVIGATINLYLSKLGEDHTKYIQSFGLHYELDKEISQDFDKVDDYIAISVKTVVDENDPINPERAYDSLKMRELYRRFLLSREDPEKKINPDSYLAKINQSVIWIDDKEEWLKRPASMCNTRYVVGNHMISYDESLRRVTKIKR